MGLFEVEAGDVGGLLLEVVVVEEVGDEVGGGGL